MEGAVFAGLLNSSSSANKHPSRTELNWIAWTGLHGLHGLHELDCMDYIAWTELGSLFY